MRRLLVPFVALATLAGLSYVMWMLYGRSYAAEAPPLTERPVVVDIVDRVVASGSIVPREEVALKPRVAGVVTELLVEPGDRVTKGQTIARVEVVANEASLAEASSRVRAGKLSLAEAERDLEQIERLSKLGAATELDLRRARLDLDMAKEQLRAAQDGLRAIRDGAVRTGKSAANLVVATIAGTVLAVPIKVGSAVVDNNSFNEGTTVATVADMDDLVFIGWVDESDVGRLSAGMPLSMTIGALEQLEVKGELERIAPKGEDREGVTQFEVRAAVRAPEGSTLRAGYSANAYIVIDRRDKVLALPEKLLQFAGTAPYVEVLVSKEPFELQRRELRLGLSDGIHVEVLGGVEADAQVRVPVPNQ